MEIIELTKENLLIHARVEAQLSFDRQREEIVRRDTREVTMDWLLERTGIKSRTTIKKKLDDSRIEPVRKDGKTHLYMLSQVRRAFPNIS